MKYALKFWPEINLVEIHHSERILSGIENIHQRAEDGEIKQTVSKLLSLATKHVTMWMENMKRIVPGIKGITAQDYLIRIEKSQSARWSEVIAPIMLILAKISDGKIEKVRANAYGKFADPADLNSTGGDSVPLRSSKLEKSLEKDAALNTGIAREMKKYPTAH